MLARRRSVRRMRVMLPAVALLLASTAHAQGSDPPAGSRGRIAAERSSPQGVAFESSYPFTRAVLRMSGPDGVVRERVFNGGETVRADAKGLPDGSYVYELALERPPGSDEMVALDREDANGRTRVPSSRSSSGGHVQSGTFGVHGGRVVDPSAKEKEPGS